MKFVLSIALFPLVQSFASAQSNPDSLWRVWNDETKPDTARIKAIGGIAVFNKTQSDSALLFR